MDLKQDRPTSPTRTQHRINTESYSFTKVEIKQGNGAVPIWDMMTTEPSYKDGESVCSLDGGTFPMEMNDTVLASMCHDNSHGKKKSEMSTSESRGKSLEAKIAELDNEEVSNIRMRLYKRQKY